MKLFATIFAFLTFTATAYADPAPLAFEHGALQAHLKWITPPKGSAEAVLAFQWVDGATNAPTNANGTLSVALWMPAMGHGSSPVKIQPGPNPGSFQISRMFFIMDGPWEVRFTLTHADGTKEMQAWAVNVGEGQ